jgi:hypothetical protein
MSGKRACTCAMLSIFCMGPLFADDQTASNPKSGFTLRPAVIDTSDGTGSTLGLEFQGSGTLISRSLDSNDAGSNAIDTTATLGDLALNYSTSGTITADKNRNPKDFLDALLDASYESSRTFGSLSGGVFYKFETDQSFANKQSVYGLRATYVKLGIFQQTDWVGLDVNYGRVDPTGDADRAAALGTTPLAQYNRADFELEYLYNVGGKLIQTLEVNYRYFLEQAPPAQIEAAGLDKHHLVTARVGLPKDLFVAYSTGKLPFDKRNDKAFELGFSYKLQ